MDSNSFIQKKRNALTLFSIVLLALVLRLYHLDYQSLWVDEIASMNGSNPEMTVSSVIQYSVLDQPPAFFLLLHGWLKIFTVTNNFDFYTGTVQFCHVLPDETPEQFKQE